jgi:N-acyl-D-aspartate/D-glutamate deacylase
VSCIQVTVFNPDTVIDRATWSEPATTSFGIEHVLVNGVFVVKGGVFQEGATPGRPVRGDGSSSKRARLGEP